MVVSGPKFGTGSNQSNDGEQWDNPTYIGANDNDYASCNPGYVSDYLACNGFGFAIPAGATITDVSFSYNRRAKYNDAIKELSVVLVDGGNDKANTSVYWRQDDEIITKHGGNAYWGVTLTPSMVNNSNFGIKIAAQTVYSGNMALVDYVTCTVTYTTSAVSGGAQLIGPVW